ncbi:MAG: ABC transporter permease [Acidobacteriota bacterium]
MNLLRLWAVVRKEFIHVMRDPRALWIGIAIPVILLMLFGYALTLDVDDVPFIVWDQSGTPESRDYISHFSASPYFQLIGTTDNYREIERAIDSRCAYIALVIPSNFARNILGGKKVEVQLIADGSDANTANIVIGYAEGITWTYSQEIILQQIRQLGGRKIEMPMDVRPRVWFNTEMESRHFIVPGLIAVIMMIIAALLTSLTVAREWETGTMEQVISTPLKAVELVLGKLVPYFLIGMFDLLLSVLMGKYLFGVPLRGNVALLFIMSSAFLIGALSLGILISIAAKTQLLASQLAFLVTFLPAFLLSGFMFDIANMPLVLQLITYLVPARYYVTLLRGLYLKGVGIEVLAIEGIFLVAFALLVLFVALIRFKKKME